LHLSRKTRIEVVPSMRVFLDKCKVVSDRLECVVRAVDAIAEVCPASSKMPGIARIHCFLGSPIRQDRLEYHIFYSQGNDTFRNSLAFRFL